MLTLNDDNPEAVASPFGLTRFLRIRPSSHLSMPSKLWHIY